MRKILELLTGDFIIKWVFRIAYFSILIIFYGIYVSAYVFLFDALITVYNLTTTLLSNLQSFSSSASSSNAVMSHFWGGLSCLGVIDALNNSKVFFLSSVTFLFLRFAYMHIVDAFKLLAVFLSPLLPK
jgi:hypothetical protein